jgi:hypothetical protein
MSRMKNAWIAALLLLSACGKKSDAPADCCQNHPPEPAGKAAPRGIARPAGIVLTGLPDSPDLAACDARGRWGIKTPSVEHSIVDPKEKGPLLPAECTPKLSLYRDSLPFPQVNWKSGDWEVTQLLFPVGKGFVARYHVMNHGEEARTAQLKVGGGSTVLAAAGRAPASELSFDLKVDPGISVFFHVTTENLAGKVADDALDQATALWEKLIGNRALVLPDPAAVTDYYANLAGQLLGVEGCAEAVAKTEAMLVRKEGNALRLMAGMPEAWQLEAIEARDLPTEFGPMTFRYQGVYNNRTLELKGACKPPDGFLVLVPEKLVPKIDGKDVKAKDGILSVPAGSTFVELFYPR